MKSTNEKQNERPKLIRAVPLRKMLGGISYTTLWRWVKKRNFPKPIKIGEKCVAWHLDEVDDWLESRPRYDKQDNQH